MSVTLTPSRTQRRHRMARPLLGLALTALALAGCSDVRRTIGLDRTSPDEFAVVSRAPLTMPPDMRLAPPRPGAARPTEASPSALAQASVFGAAQGGRSAETSGEMALLSRAGADRAESDIRAKVDQETTQLIVADGSWIDSLLFWQTQQEPSTLVDPAKEAQRLRQAQAQGQPLNEGVVPTIERKRKAPLEGLF